MRHLGKLDVATGFEKSPKVQYISQSGHTACLHHASVIPSIVVFVLRQRAVTTRK